MNKLVRSALFVSLATVAGGATAQSYNNQQSDEAGEVIMQVLQNVLGNQYQSDRRYQNRAQQDAFRLADTNRDGRLSQYEIDAYRARFGYRDHRDNKNDYRYDRRGIRISEIDLNRDGWLSRREQEAFLRRIDLDGRRR